MSGRLYRFLYKGGVSRKLESLGEDVIGMEIKAMEVGSQGC